MIRDQPVIAQSEHLRLSLELLDSGYASKICHVLVNVALLSAYFFSKIA
jgi:hypothetical protein